MMIAMGADHAGYGLKDHLAEMLRGAGHDVDDLGTNSGDSVDYPDFGAAVARKVASGSAELGILVCGTGVGIAMAASKIRGVRAATCNEIYSAGMARAHNNANVLALGARVVGQGVAEEIVKAFLGTEFEGGRHGRRVGKINALED